MLGMRSSKFKKGELKDFLDEQVDRFNTPSFISDDPIQIPHRFSKKQDIEIAGLFAAILAWGQRPTIIRKCTELLELMGNEPHHFVLNHNPRDLKPFLNFKHRTFNATDTLYFLSFLQWYYQRHKSLSSAFTSVPDDTIEPGLIAFHRTFFSLDHAPHRTRKHISTPERRSTCKRLNMYLRWMVRSDDRGVDFGIWRDVIIPAQLVCPCDVHVDRVARSLKLITRKQTDWQTALELTKRLREFDPDDPVKYDFALFGIGVTRLR